MLVFRENNIEVKKAVKTWLSDGKKVSFKIIAGSGKAFESQFIEEGKIIFELPQKNSFALYFYSIK